MLSLNNVLGTCIVTMKWPMIRTADMNSRTDRSLRRLELAVQETEQFEDTA